MGWREQFHDKLVTAAEAVRRVKDGDLVRLPMGAVPVTLVNALRSAATSCAMCGSGKGRAAISLRGRAASRVGKSTFSSCRDFLSPMLRPVMESRRADFAVTDYAIAEQGAALRAAGQLGRQMCSWRWYPSPTPTAGQLRLQSLAFEVAAARREAPRRRDQRPRAATRGDNFVHLSEFHLLVEDAIEHVPPPLPTLVRNAST